MEEHPNATAVRRAGEAMKRGDMQTMDAFLADDVIWHGIGRSEPLRGKDALRASMAGTDYEITFEIHDVVANDEHTIALGEATATRGGKTLKYRTAEIYHIKDGKATERWAFSDDTAAIIAFFA